MRNDSASHCSWNATSSMSSFVFRHRLHTLDLHFHTMDLFLPLISWRILACCWNHHDNTNAVVLCPHSHSHSPPHDFDSISHRSLAFSCGRYAGIEHLILSFCAVMSFLKVNSQVTIFDFTENNFNLRLFRASIQSILSHFNIHIQHEAGKLHRAGDEQNHFVSLETGG